MRSRFALAVGVGSATCLALAAAADPGIDGGETLRRISVSSGGSEGNADSSRPSISASGRLVAFYSDADNLVPGDTNLTRDVFVHDRVSGETRRVSMTWAGIQGDGPSSRPAISGSGRFVAFTSAATNLVVNDTNGARDVFVRDLEAAVTVRVSVAGDGGQANGESARPSISGDGRFVAFESVASNLANGVTNGAEEVYLRDRDADGDGLFDEPGQVATIRVSVTPGGGLANGPSTWAVISGDGRHVAFRSAASNLVAGDTNGARDIFVRDLLAAATVRVSVGHAGQQGNDESSRPSITADGRFVAFHSDAFSFVPGDTNLNTDVFVRDRDLDADGVYDEPGGTTTVRVSVSSAGEETFGGSEDPSISDDGRFVTFWSNGTGLVEGDTNVIPDAFVHDRDADRDGDYDEAGAGEVETVRLSTSDGGSAGNAQSDQPVISGNGSVVAFKSAATNLVEGDTNASRDVFLRVVEPLPGDLDGDGLVNAADLQCVITSWGVCPAKGPCPGDANDDGVVDVFDLVWVVIHWLPLG